MTDGHRNSPPATGRALHMSYDDDTTIASSTPARASNGTASPDHLYPGTMLGEYEIERKIGEGGMGTVFAAVHPLIGKRAAIKVLMRDLCKDPHAIERLVDEARVVNQIGHPNIVDVFAFGSMPDGRHYLVMELLQGETLGARIASRRLTLAETCAVLKPLSRALKAAHDKGVTHRDLKPENVFLVTVPGEPELVKLLDFGIAKLSYAPHVARTATGAMIGTPQYMAPEQAKGYAVDARADIYAFGGILFELLTGRPPFVADNASEIIAKHLMEEPPRLSALASVPAELDDLVAATLSKDPNERPTLDRIYDVLDRQGRLEGSDSVPGGAIAARAIARTPPEQSPGVIIEPRGPAALTKRNAPATIPTRRAGSRYAKVLGATALVAAASFFVVRTLARAVAERPVAVEPASVPAVPTVEAKPTTVEPEPKAVEPRPVIVEARPVIVEPRPVIDPVAVEPDPAATDHKPVTADARPVTGDPDKPAIGATDRPPSDRRLDKRRPPRIGHLELAIHGAHKFLVVVDGKSQGMRTALALPPGPHRIEVRAEGELPQRFAIQIEAGKTEQHDVTWTHAVVEPKLPPGDGDLLPPGATVPKRPQ